MLLYFSKKRIAVKANALLAQLDRVFGYEPKGQGFESLAARQKNAPNRVRSLCYPKGTRTRREERSAGRKQSGGLFSPTRQRAKRGDRRGSAGQSPLQRARRTHPTGCVFYVIQKGLEQGGRSEATEENSPGDCFRRRGNIKALKTDLTFYAFCIIHCISLIPGVLNRHKSPARTPRQRNNRAVPKTIFFHGREQKTERQTKTLAI